MVNFGKKKKALAILAIVAIFSSLVPIKGGADSTDDAEQARAFQTFVATSTTYEASYGADGTGAGLTKDVITPLVSGGTTGVQNTFGWNQLSEGSANGDRLANRIKKLRSNGWIVTNSDNWLENAMSGVTGIVKSVGIGALSVLLMIGNVISTVVDSVVGLLQAFTFSNVIISTVSQKLGIQTGANTADTSLVPDNIKTAIAELYVLIVGVGFLLVMGTLVMFFVNIHRHRRRVWGKKAMWGFLTVVTLPTMLVAVGLGTQLASNSKSSAYGGFMKGLIVNTRGLALEGFSVDLPKGSYDPVSSSSAQNAITATWSNANDIPWATVLNQALSDKDNYYTAQAYLDDVMQKNISSSDGYDLSANLPATRAYVPSVPKSQLVDVSNWETATGGTKAYSEDNWGQAGDSNYGKLLAFLTGRTDDKNATQMSSYTTQLKNIVSAGGASAEWAKKLLESQEAQSTNGTSADNSTTILPARQLWLDRFVYLASQIGSKDYFQANPSPEQIFNIQNGGAISLDGKTAPMTIGSTFWLLQTKLDSHGGTITAVNANPNGSGGAKQVRTADIAKWRSYVLATNSLAPLILYVIGMTLITLIATIAALIGLATRLPEMFKYGFKTWAGSYIERTQDAYLKAVVVMAGSGLAIVAVKQMPFIVTEVLQLIPNTLVAGVVGVQNATSHVVNAGGGAVNAVGILGVQAGLTVMLAGIYLGLAYLLLFKKRGFNALDTAIMFPWIIAKEIVDKGNVTRAFNANTIKNATKSAERDRKARQEKITERMKGVATTAGTALAVGTGGASGLATTGLTALKNNATSKLAESSLGQVGKAFTTAKSENTPALDEEKGQHQEDATRADTSTGVPETNTAEATTGVAGDVPETDTGVKSDPNTAENVPEETALQGVTENTNDSDVSATPALTGNADQQTIENQNVDDDHVETINTDNSSSADEYETHEGGLVDNSDTTSQSFDTVNQNGDTVNQAGDTTTQTGDTVNQGGNTVNQAGDTTTQGAETTNQYTTNEGGISQGGATTNRYTTTQTGDTVNQAGDTTNQYTTSQGGVSNNQYTTNNSSSTMNQGGATTTNTTNNSSSTTNQGGTTNQYKTGVADNNNPYMVHREKSSQPPLESQDLQRIKKVVTKALDDKTVTNPKSDTDK